MYNPYQGFENALTILRMLIGEREDYQGLLLFLTPSGIE